MKIKKIVFLVIIIIIFILIIISFYKKNEILLNIKNNLFNSLQKTISKILSGKPDNIANNWESSHSQPPILAFPPEGERDRTEKDNTKTKEQINKEKIKNLRKRSTLKWEIEIAKMYLNNNEYIIALPKYLKIFKKIPNDEWIIREISYIYFSLKKFKSAYSFFKKIKKYDDSDKHFALKSLISSKELTSENILKIKTEIKHFWLNEQEKFYYTNSLLCVIDFSLCKKIFTDYFQKSQKEKKKIIFEELNTINSALINYKNFKLSDLSYKNALITWAFFSNWLYKVAIKTWEKILIEKKDYKPIIKIIAKSYFELWEYDKSKEYLLQYIKIDKKDSEISYLLWFMYWKLHDYVLSSIHLKNSIEMWYTNSIDARRMIIYNYNQVWEIDKMLKSFKEMVKKEDITMSDINLAIYHHIINEKIKEAKEITLFAMWRYSTKDKKTNKNIIKNGDTLYWYLWRIQLKEEDVEWHMRVAEKNLNLALELNPKNSMIHYVMWKLRLKEWKKDKALECFEKVIKLWNIEEFSRLAEEEIKKIWEI